MLGTAGEWLGTAAAPALAHTQRAVTCGDVSRWRHCGCACGWNGLATTSGNAEGCVPCPCPMRCEGASRFGMHSTAAHVVPPCPVAVVAGNAGLHWEAPGRYWCRTVGRGEVGVAASRRVGFVLLRGRHCHQRFSVRVHGYALLGCCRASLLALAHQLLGCVRVQEQSRCSTRQRWLINSAALHSPMRCRKHVLPLFVRSSLLSALGLLPCLWPRCVGTGGSRASRSWLTTCLRARAAPGSVPGVSSRR